INMFSMDTRTVGNDITSEIDVVNLKAWIAGNLVYEKGKGSTFPDTIYGGSSFKFALNWKAKDSTKRFSSGDTFHINIGTITGLNMSEAKTSNLYINGIKVAESKLTYISNVLTYTVTFNESIKYFENLQGNFTSNTTFINVDSDKKIEIEFETNSKGEITIIKKPVLPGTGGDTGVGLPPVAPIYKELVAIGKSTFFVDYNNPFLGWRIVFTDLLHKNQENINTPANTEYTEDLIIEDILDENQEFADEAEIGFGVPFYLDIPMMLPGTQSAVAYTSSVEGRNVNPVLPEGNGNSYYIIKPTADKFVKLNSEEAVRNKPFSWAIVNVSNRQKLVVNLGKLGTKDIAKGITTDFITNRISTTPTIDKLDEVIAGEIKKYEDAIIKCGESGTSCSAEYKQNVADTIEALKRAKTYYGLQENRIYGFNLKYKTKVVNTSTGKVSNEAKITTGKLEYDVDSEVNHSYDSGISGVFSKGDIVLMKADQTYGYTESDLSSSKNLVGMKDINLKHTM
ncbi:MAG: Ig-like domain-containing protein, partial [Longicatena sp.]